MTINVCRTVWARCRAILRGCSLSAGLLVLLFLTVFVFPVSAVPIVTVIDDDAANETAIATVKAVADRCGIKVTFAAVASFLERNPKVPELLRQYEAEGHEIASHSLSHRPGIWQTGGTIDIGAIEREMVESEAIFTRLDLHPKTFVYPYGNFPRGVRREIFDVIGRYYPVAFNARGDINLPGRMYPLYVSRHPLRKHNSMFMTKRLIDEAVSADEAWVVILTHSAKSDFSAEMLETIIRYAQEAGAVVLPASAAWERVRAWPMMDEDDIPDYSLFGDYLNAAFFHLPLLLGGGIAIIVLCGAALVLFLRHRAARRKKAAV